MRCARSLTKFGGIDFRAGLWLVLFMTVLKLFYGLALVVSAVSAKAQIGAGWQETKYDAMLNPEIRHNRLKIQPIPKVYHGNGCSYTNADGVETFSLLNTNSTRIEIRVYNTYTNGQHQFEGDVRFSAPLDNEGLMQIFGNTTHATLFMLRGWAENGGSLKYYADDVLATNAYDRWFHVNVINDRDKHVTQVYLDGTLKGEWTDTDNAPNYFKYGCYGIAPTNRIDAQWKNVKFFEK